MEQDQMQSMKNQMWEKGRPGCWKTARETREGPVRAAATVEKGRILMHKEMRKERPLMHKKDGLLCR